MWLLRKLSATIIALLILIIAFFYFFHHIEMLSIPSDFEKITSQKLNKEVSVYQNNLGISHIVASNENDAYFMLGYIQARDRLWQMDIKRRTAIGHLSEIFGKKYLDYDIFLRTLNLSVISEKILKSLDKETISILNDYSNGINSYIKNNSDKLSFEFSALNYKPNFWKPIDCILLQRLFAIQTSPAFKYEIVFGEIAEKIGYKKTLSLLPNYPINSPSVLSEKRFFSKDTNQQLSKYFSPKNKFDNLAYLSKNFTIDTNSIKIYEDFFRPNLLACNNWAVSSMSKGIKSTILANDFHSNLELPSMWYPVHLTYGKINIIGFMLPGIPVFWAGSNNKISWGISSTMLDDCDFFVEKSTKDKKKYITSSNDTINYIYVKDTIKISNSDNYYYYRIFSKRSPIFLNYFRVNNQKKSNDNKFEEKYQISYNWVGSEFSNELLSLVKISKSSNWEEFKNALKTWSVPSLNFSYADSSGNIGLLSCGRILNRNKKTNPILPNPAWLPEYDSKGIKQGNILGKLYNPMKKFVSASNNILIDSILPYLSNYWEPDSREKRIEQLLAQYQTFENYEYGYLDAQRMQLDKYSVYAKELFARILPIIKLNLINLNSDEQKVFRILEKWDYLMSPDKISPTIFKAFIYMLEKNIFYDDLGEKLFNKYTKNNSLILRKLLDLFNKHNDYFFDNIRTKPKESKTYIVITSFKETVKYLENRFKTRNFYEWKYSKINRIILNHEFTYNDFLKPVVAIKPIEVGGDRTTINLTDIPSFEKNNKNCIGSSYRMVIDIKDMLMLISIPGGISGDPLNPNYKNMVQVWKNGGYIKLSSKSNPDKSFKLKVKANKY